MPKNKEKLPSSREAGLLSLLINGEKYGREIRNAYQDRFGRWISYGALYTTLDRMEDKRFLKSRMGESKHRRGGFRRKYYRITGAGERVLNAYEMYNAAVRNVGNE